MSIEKPIPSVLAMLLCDVILTDIAPTSKKTLVGIFDRFWTDQLPVAAPGFVLYAKLTDMAGQYQMRVDVVNLHDEQRLASFTVSVESPADRLQPFEFVVRFPPGLKFDGPGAYEFQLYADEAFIGRCVVNVEKKEVLQ
jgi:hypothetical protein